MNLLDIITLAGSGLKRRRARTFLTVTGVVVGTLCIVLMLSIGISNYAQFQEYWEDQSLTQIDVYPSVNSVGSDGLGDYEINTLSGIANVKKISPVQEFPVTVKAGKYEAQLYITALELEFLKLEFSYGRAPGRDETPPGLILGYDQMQQFIDPDNPPDYRSIDPENAYRPSIDWENEKMTLSLNWAYENPDTEENMIPVSKVYPVKISGITKQSYDASSYTTYMDLQAAKRLLTENRKVAETMGISMNGYPRAIVEVQDTGSVKEVLDEIKKMGYEAYSSMENIQQMQEEQNRQQSQLFLLGFITLFVSAIGIANTMYANILERRKEIGIMKVVGMSIGNIRLQFIIESACIGGLGGILGIALSYFVSFFLNLNAGEVAFLGMYFSDGMQLSIPWWLTVCALGISVGVGVISGIYPAIKATQMSAMEALQG